ncbi:UNVERIFIED_CONTAM: putative WRKY transcription factor 65 [Sesamum radiatum]|uniref:WRKY transcription factor 65 n=1 Tax=Sesamum radiatum TaxID=300843 RepID=A0AAW2LSE7_SESRA
MGMKRRTLNRNHFVISQVLEDSAHTLPEDNTDNISMFQTYQDCLYFLFQEKESQPRCGVPAAATTTTTSVSEEEVEVEDENDEGEGEGEEEEEEEKKPISTHHHELIFEDKFSNIDEEAPPPAPPLINGGEFGWLTDFEYSTSCTMLESPILEEERIITTDDNEMAMIFTTREEDESLFGDLGELPECSMVFRRGMAQREVEHRRHSFATTG